MLVTVLTLSLDLFLVALAAVSLFRFKCMLLPVWSNSGVNLFYLQ